MLPARNIPQEERDHMSAEDLDGVALDFPDSGNSGNTNTGNTGCFNFILHHLKFLY